jgi:molybdate/tungstate transport system substrate-binding protein
VTRVRAGGRTTLRRWTLAARAACLVSAIALWATGAAGCGGVPALGGAATTGGATVTAPPAGRNETVEVLYGASLVQVMEEKLGPAFSAATGSGFQGEGKGSVAAANLMLEGQRSPDVFITPDAEVNRRLMGAANKDLVRWFVTFAGTELVMAYNPKSRFAADLERAATGGARWYEVIDAPGVKIGRADPELAPLGYRTLFAFSLAEAYYGVAGLRTRILGQDANTDQIFPAEELVARLEAGQLDVAFVYRASVEPVGLPYVTLPAEVNQGDSGMAARYATQSYTSAKKGVTYTGAPIVYTATVLTTASHPAAAISFVLFLLSDEGRALLSQAGLGSVEARSGGDADAMPAEIRALVRGELSGT